VMSTPPSSFSITNCDEVRNTMIIWAAFWRMDMEFHKGMSSSGRLYGFLPDFATLDEDCDALDELDAARVVESFTSVAEELEVARVADELLSAGVICCSLDEDDMAHMVSSDEELAYNSVSFCTAGAVFFADALVAGMMMLSSMANGALALGMFPEASAEQVAKRASVYKSLKVMTNDELYYSSLFFFAPKRRGLNSRGGKSNLSLPFTSVR